MVIHPNPAHELVSIPEIIKIVGEYAPELIVELGTFQGGGTMMFHVACPSAIIHTFDIKDLIRDDERHLFKGKYNIYFHIEDTLTLPSSEVIKFCRLPIRKLLYCDGGNKVGELWMYSHLLRPGDLLGMHDYMYEFTLQHIHPRITIFEPFKHEVFERMGVPTRFWIRRGVDGAV